MAELDLLIKAWDHAHWELSEAFVGLPDEDVWKRPHPNLLSVGELAGHIAYGELEHCQLMDTGSPFARSEFRYYPHIKSADLEFTMGAEAVFAEVQRVHDLARASYLATDLTAEDPHPVRKDWTWGYALEYMVFHIAYHTGQIYSVRHLLGHETVDN